MTFVSDVDGLMQYESVPRVVGAVVSSRLASFEALDSTLGTRDLYDLMEIVLVDAYNRRRIEEHHRRNDG